MLAGSWGGFKCLRGRGPPACCLLRLKQLSCRRGAPRCGTACTPGRPKPVRNFPMSKRREVSPKQTHKLHHNVSSLVLAMGG
jgi:hypothetical protein